MFNSSKWIPLFLVAYCGTIAHGHLVNSIADYPWHVGIYVKNMKHGIYHICNGNIIKPKVILSVANCFTDYKGKINKEYLWNEIEYFVAAGKIFKEYDIFEDAEKRKVKKVIVPPEYKGYFLSYFSDIAILELEQELPMNNKIKSISLDFDYKLKPNALGKVVGWNIIIKNEKQDNSRLKMLEVPYIERNKCLEIVTNDYRPFIVDDHICAGLISAGSSLCAGDTGSGLVFPKEDGSYVLVGVASNGPIKEDMCDSDQITSYTNVNMQEEFITHAIKNI